VDNYGTDFNQAYPGSYPGSNFPARSGANEVGTLHYSFGSAGDLDSVYPMTYTVSHTSPSLTISFTGEGLQDLADESWGLANVEVTISAASAPIVNETVYLPLIAK
jgi:hypothetical protein